MPIFEQLEPRILLSADLIPLPVDADSPSITEPFEELQDNTETSVNSTPATDVTIAATPSEDTVDLASPAEDPTPLQDETDLYPTEIDSDIKPASITDESDTLREVIFINDDIDGFDELREDLEEREYSDVIILDSKEDGFSQINTALGSTEDIQAIHFFTHANSSSIKVGSTWIDSTSVNSNQDSISSWGEHLTSEGDILFYGCDLAASTAGTELLQEIADLTGADVAASSDTTGHQSLSADWDLEYTIGVVDTTIAVSPTLQGEWLHILAEETIADDFETAAYDNNDGSVNWVSDWIEIGDDDDAGNGNVLVQGGELHIISADNNEAERGISRVADLSGASSAFLSIDARGVWGSSWGELSVEMRADSSDAWSTLADYYIYTQDVTIRFDITSFISDTTEIRFISEGSYVGGLSQANSDVFVDNLHIDYTTDNWSMPLWLSTDNTVNNGGQTGISSWDKADIIGLDNSSPLLGPQTEGEFSMAAQLSTFSEGAEVNALHYVTTNMLIGTSEFELKVGDILFSSENPDQKSFGNIDASRDDIIHFRPSTSGDYSAGTFTILFEEVVKDKKVWGLTLVEKDVTVGDRDLHAGDLLFIRDGGDEHSDVYHYTTIDVEPGSGSTNGTVSVLLEGDDDGIDISEQLRGIDLIERTITIGNTQLEEGTILLTIKENDSLNGTNVWKNDIFALNVTTTSASDGSTDDLGNATASKFFDGSDVSFDSNDEKIDAFSLTVREEIPEPTFTGVSFDAQAKTITLTGTNLDFLGDIGSNVKDQLDWSKITWDVNGDGSTTPDITFDITNVPTVITSTTTLTIHLTGAKALDITETPGYAEDGGTDTLTILPGFVSNEAGDVATTDGLTDAPISTTTGPVGISLTNDTIPENTDTTGGLTIGTLSTVDSDAGDTHIYTITGGVDNGLFSIGGTNGDELILEAGLLDHETKSSYIVEITVTDGSGQTDTEIHTIFVSDIDETPIITENSLTINEDQTVTLTTADLAATDEESVDANLLFTVETVDGGQFQNNDALGTAIFSFYQADVAAGKIIFIDDGDETAPSYSLSVSDGTLTSMETAAAIAFTHINDAPVISSNTLSLYEGERKTLSTSDLIVSDNDNNPNELIFTVNSVSEGQFELSTDQGNAITSFTQEDLNAGTVQFVHNGGEATPSYSLSLSDGDNSFGPSDAVIILTPVNDAPVIQRNSLDILEGESKLITDLQLLAIDPDDDATTLTYTISNTVAGYFFTTGDDPTDPTNAITSFTQDEINNGLVSFFHDDDGTDTPPSYDVEVHDGEVSSGVMAASVNFNTINDTPTFATNSLDIAEGESFSLTDQNFSATDPDHGPESLIFTVSGVSQGQFESTDNLGTAIASFTQADINAGKIIFKHDGGEVGPSYTATVSDGSLSDSLSSSISFTPVNDAPEITTNTITLSEGDTVTITSSILAATDVDDTNSSLNFTLSGITGGIFTTTADTSTAISSFTQAQVTAGNIQFIHNGGEDAPTYQVTVTDGGGLTSTPQAANVIFTEVNDAPQLINNNLSVDEGGTVTISAVNLSANDPDSISSTLTFTVDNISGGQFERTSLVGGEILSFSQAEVLAGEIIFVHDEAEEAAPAYEITVTDDGAPPLSTTPSAATITFTSVNDVPELTVNTVTLSEGDTITLDSSILAATDSDSNVPDLIFTVTDLIAGTFTNINDPGTPITSFTQAQVTSGDIRVNHDGGEIALSYKIEVSDQNLTTTAADAVINFTEVNDAPTITNLASTVSYTEDTPHTLSGIILADADSGTTYQVSLDLSDDLAGTLNTNSIGTATSTFAGGTLTITGSNIDDVNAILAATTFTPATDYTDDFTISINATDGLAPAAEETKNFHAILVNDAPQATNLIQTGTYTEDVVYDLDDITISDADDNETVSAQMTLTDPTHGTLSTGGGAAFDEATGVWSISGTVAEVNNALSLVSFTSAADSFVDTSIAIEIEDGRENGVTPLGGTITLAGKAVADAPVVSSVGTLTSTPSEPIYVTASSADGTEVTHFQITTIENGELHRISDLSQIVENDFITVADGITGLIFTPNSDNQGNFTVIGSDNGTTVAPESTTATSTITVTAPDLAVPAEPSDPASGGSSGDLGGGNIGEILEPIEDGLVPIEDITSVDETLKLVTGQDTGTGDTGQAEDSSSADSDDNSSKEDSGSENENSADDEIDDALSYVNAQKISDSASNSSAVAIAAAFDNLTFDLSFENTSINSFVFSSTPSQTIKSDSVSLSDSPEHNDIFSTSNYDLLDLEYRDRSFEDYQSVRKSLENFREQTKQEASIEKTVVGSAIAASTGLSAGYVIWLLRSGALLSSILSSLPAWQLADPLAVLAGAKGDEDDEDDSIESIIEKSSFEPPPEEKPSHPQKDSFAPKDNR